MSASDAYFGGQQHSGADFRLRNGGGQVTVHSVAVKVSGDGVPDAADFAPPVRITSPAAGATVTRAPDVRGAAEPGAKVTVTADGTPVHRPGPDDGTWTCTASRRPPRGSHTLTATAQDATATPARSEPVTVTIG